RRRGYARSSRALAGMTMQGWAGDCIALLNHLGIASAHVAGHSFGAGIALQMAIDAPGRVRKLALLEPPLGSLVPSGEQFTEWVASVREIYDSGDKTAATDIILAGTYAFLMKLEGLSHQEIAPSGGGVGPKMLDDVYGRPTGAQVPSTDKSPNKVC